MSIAIGCLAVVVAALVGFLVYKKCFSHGPSWKDIPPPKKVNLLTFKEVIAFFRQREVMEVLKTTPDAIAVAIREKKEDGVTSVILCSYNKKSNMIVFPFAHYECDSLDEELVRVFGDKNMIVLK